VEVPGSSGGAAVKGQDIVFVSGPTGKGNAKLSSCLDADLKSFSLQGVTNYFELREAKEIEQGKGLVDAIKQGGVNAVRLVQFGAGQQALEGKVQGEAL
jgi:hypothetical protein